MNSANITTCKSLPLEKAATAFRGNISSMTWLQAGIAFVSGALTFPSRKPAPTFNSDITVTPMAEKHDRDADEQREYHHLQEFAVGKGGHGIPGEHIEYDLAPGWHRVCLRCFDIPEPETRSNLQQRHYGHAD